ncbi:MAG: peptidylprolyl isomerase [Candidatus Poriferisodalaceae bacterium]|tara:strand:- start:1333 stop:2160 length:828 start_codon:yes stop_codon:yes gene_type:complete
MSNNKRERQRAHRQAQADAAQQAQKSSKRTKIVIRWVAIGAAVLVIAFLWSLTGNDEDTAQIQDTAAEASIGAEALGIEGCPAVDGSSERQTQFETPPKLCIDTGQLYSAEFATNLGDFTVVLDPTLDSRSVNNFIFLARHHAYDETIFHRVIDQFVIQGGDVEGLNGRGGPGYKFTGAYGPEEGYLVGSLAMANQGTPNTNGSQFFIVTGPFGASLDPNYSLMGHVVAGLDVALAIQKAETDSQDLPVKPVSISSVTISEATSSEIDIYKDLTD